MRQSWSPLSALAHACGAFQCRMLLIAPSESRQQRLSRHRTTSEKVNFTTSATFHLSSGDEESGFVRPCFWLFFVDVVSDVVFLTNRRVTGCKGLSLADSPKAHDFWGRGVWESNPPTTARAAAQRF